MRNVLRTRALMLLVLGVMGWVVAGCGADLRGRSAATENGAEPQAVQPGAGLMLAPDLLSHAGLRTTWDQTLPLKKGERFVSALLRGDRLYLRSNQNYLWSLDRTKGDVVFSRSLAAPGIPVLGLVVYEKSLISVIGNRLVELDLDSGKEQRVSDLNLSIVAPPARNSRYFYISAADRRLHVFDANNLVQTFAVAADNDSLITTVLADEKGVAFGTDTGNVVGMAPDAPRRLWQFKATEAVAGPLVPDANSFYVASTDTNVYRVDVAEATGATLAWRYQSEAILDRAPLVTKDFVYQYAVGRGLTALAKGTGKAVWSLPEGVDLLAETGPRAYVLAKTRTLTVMDNATGRPFFSVNFAPVAHHAANTVDARIYVMNDTGRVVCLEPAL